MSDLKGNLKRKYHVFILGFAFMIFCLSILVDTYMYFFLAEFYEGFVVIGQVIVFDLLGIILAIPFVIKRDFKTLGIVGLFFLTLTVIGSFGFNISLILLPLISGIASIMMFRIGLNYPVSKRD